MALTYKDAGVDIQAGNDLVKNIAPLAKSTLRPEVLGTLGGFAGLMEIPAGYKKPVLVSGTDGVGTKLKTAVETGIHNTVGIDLVAMCVNDIIVTGAEPLFFLDYFGCGKLSVEDATSVVSGVAKGCIEAGCSLVGGETAELPGMYPSGEYDLAGFCVGVVEKENIKTPKTLKEKDVVIGLHSTGLHSNGHSLARKVFLEHKKWTMDKTFGKETLSDWLLEPTKIYAKALKVLDGVSGPAFKVASHITGGGLVENPPRVLGDKPLAMSINLGSWPEPKVFGELRNAGIEEHELRKTFNMGLGMLVVVDKAEAKSTISVLQKQGTPCSVVGELVSSPSQNTLFKEH